MTSHRCAFLASLMLAAALVAPAGIAHGYHHGGYHHDHGCGVCVGLAVGALGATLLAAPYAGGYGGLPPAAYAPPVYVPGYPYPAYPVYPAYPPPVYLPAPIYYPGEYGYTLPPGRYYRVPVRGHWRGR